MFDEYEQLFISSSTSDINDIQKIITTNFINNTFKKDTNDFFLPTKIVIKSLYNLENVNEEIIKILSGESFVRADYNQQIKLLEEDYRRKQKNIFDKLYVHTVTSLYSFDINEVNDEKLEEIFSLKRSNLIDIEISN